MEEVPKDRPARIYLVEECCGPSKDGPWGPWFSEQSPKLLFPRPMLSVRMLTKDEMKPRCMRIGWRGNKAHESWRKLRCIPYVPAEPSVEVLSEITRAIRDEYFEQQKPGSHTESDEDCTVTDWVAIAQKGLEKLNGR